MCYEEVAALCRGPPGGVVRVVGLSGLCVRNYRKTVWRPAVQVTWQLRRVRQNLS